MKINNFIETHTIFKRTIYIKEIENFVKYKSIGAIEIFTGM
jgi:hypothetical protein